MSQASAMIAAIAAPGFRGTLQGTATDDAGSLRVTVAPTGRLLDVEVREMRRELKSPAGFRAALLGTYRAAEAARLLAEVERSGALEQMTPEEVAAPLPPIPSGARRSIALRSPDERANAYYRYLAEGLDEVGARPGLSWGSSGNGYLWIGFTEGGRPRDVDVDRQWLEAVRPEQITRALKEAINDGP